MRESKIERCLREAAAAQGWAAYKFNSAGHPGVPDRLCLGPGSRMFFVETKAPGGLPSPEQTREHARLRRRGFRVFVVDSIDAVWALPWGE